MLYLFYQYAVAHHIDFPGLNLLKFLTFRGGAAVATAQLVVVLMGSRFIRWMRTKQGRGQPIREDGIQRHIVEKAGTPTMGGLMFLAGITVATLLWADLDNVYVWVMLLVTLSFGGLGFMDDYAKVTKQTTAGISGRMRLAVEAGVALLAVFLMIWFGQPSPESAHLSTSLVFPIFKKAVIDLGWFWCSGPSSSSARRTR
jgi:phospho-N-acetylmuramoyl-pentapeptide-transferase